jgi:hypothetical protein
MAQPKFIYGQKVTFKKDSFYYGQSATVKSWHPNDDREDQYTVQLRNDDETKLVGYESELVGG